MQLVAGTRLGPYEVLSAIGAGGMGEVFRARDTRLDRDVAIKVLPASFASNAQLRMRFDREAKAISSLNHPHICTLHDVGHENGVHYIVMELIDGESLADRLSKGPLPPAQVLRYGIEIATALDAAHRQGIVHRDLKPGNIMLTRAGAKLLDFGLARTGSDVAIDGFAPTVARPLTEEGTIVGTFQYMAPEQLEGLPADRRTDIFALGAVLYEMATGRRAFDGKTRTSLIAAIVSAEPPPIATVQPLAPAGLWRVIQLCLRKDPEERWQSAHDVRLELENIRDVEETAAPSRKSWPWGVAALLAIALAAVAFMAGRYGAVSKRAGATHLNIVGPSGGNIREMALSPDGRTLVLTGTAGTGAREQLWLRDLASGNTRALEGTVDAFQPFWSPDGKFLAFMRGSSLQRMAVSGGAIETICAVKEPFGGTWNGEGTIVFAQADGRLYRVNASGGEAQRLPAHGQHLAWPSFLPDGRTMLVLTDGGPSAPTSIAVTTLDGKEPPRAIVPAISNVMYAASGHLLYVRSRSLVAQPFDLESLQTSGEPVVIAPQVDDNDFSQYVFTEAGGTIAWRSRDVRSQLRLRDRSGKELARFGEPADWAGVAVSPDGTRALVEQVDEARRNGSLWLVDLQRGGISRFSTAPGWHVLGTWAPDSERFAYGLSHEGTFKVYEGRVNATTTRLIAGMECHPQSWSGDWIGCETGTPETAADIALLSVSTGKRLEVATTKAWENFAQLSPDGKWVAYGSNGSVYVQPVPPDGRRWEAASERFGGALWSRDGKTLFFVEDGALLVAAIGTEGGSFSAGPLQPIMKVALKNFKNRAPAAILGNGDRFLFNEPVSDSAPSHIVLRWTEMLEK